MTSKWARRPLWALGRVRRIRRAGSGATQGLRGCAPNARARNGDAIVAVRGRVGGVSVRERAGRCQQARSEMASQTRKSKNAEGPLTSDPASAPPTAAEGSRWPGTPTVEGPFRGSSTCGPIPPTTGVPHAGCGGDAAMTRKRGAVARSVPQLISDQTSCAPILRSTCFAQASYA